ncbi:MULTISPECIES: HupE/UreJ family protein [Neobacillus]|uniref:HupE/UreJ family protein n=1 Tax=Neobacillus rhizophilus TaxID=2833579 RepID=A0A942YW94_9BACI|nr:MULTISPECIES: HupE/UreJ family protein [Neobacillus]MBS4214722.1 HupE/UreJ family protein [Neobacillus rhizophilus]
MKKLWLPILFFLLAFSSVLPTPSSAHTNNSEGFSSIEVKEKSLDYELKLDLEELGHALNKTTAEKELINNKIVEQYINTHIKLYADSQLIEGSVEKTDIETIKERPFAVINLAYNIEHKPEKLVMEYNMFMDDSDPSHANFATIKMDGKQQEKILTFESRELEIGEVSLLQNVKQFVVLGLEHIFTGYDHILFIISLLFGAKTFRHILSLVTAFTIAHSITLALATFDIVQLPSRFVESAIALSIIYVALMNIFNKDSKHQPWLAFAFGLIHGFGFAGILSEMRLDTNHMARSLLSFNIGIEIGQLIIVSLVYPLILWIKKLTLKPIKWVIPGTSAAILAFGLVWFIERAF